MRRRRIVPCWHSFPTTKNLTAPKETRAGYTASAGREGLRRRWEKCALRPIQPLDEASICVDEGEGGRTSWAPIYNDVWVFWVFLSTLLHRIVAFFFRVYLTSFLFRKLAFSYRRIYLCCQQRC